MWLGLNVEDLSANVCHKYEMWKKFAGWFKGDYEAAACNMDILKSGRGR